MCPFRFRRDKSQVRKTGLFDISALTQPSPRTLGLRRPTTTDTDDFWYVSQEAWDEYMAKTRSGDKFTIDNAVRALNKYNRAGRLMETDEGVVASTPCYWCARPGMQKVCMVGAEGGTCAYCYRLARAHCSAKLTTKVAKSRASTSRTSVSKASASGASLSRASMSRASASTATTPSASKSTATTSSAPASEGRLEQRPVGRITAVEESANASADELVVLRGELADAQAQLATALTKIEALEKTQQTCVHRIDELARTLFGDIVAQ